MTISAKPSRSKTNVLLMILILAAAIRLWRLDSLPPGLYHDEAYNGLDALSIINGATFPRFYEGWELYAEEAHAGRPPVESRWPLFFEGNYGREPLHIYLMALSVSVFGATPFAIRLVPALAGVLAVWATYLATTVLLADPSGKSRNGMWRLSHFPFVDAPLVAAFAVAILYPAIHFSRFGLRVMLFVPIMAMVVYFFWSGINAAVQDKPPLSTSIMLRFVAAGLFLALGIYTYAAARLLPLLFVVFIRLWIWQDRAVWRRHRSHFFLMATAALLSALPLLIYFFRNPYFFVFRVTYVANRGKGAIEGKPWLTWLLNIGRVVRGFLWQGETHLRHNLPGRPYLDPIQAFFFLAGLITGRPRSGNPRFLFLCFWLLVMLLPSILSGDAPHFGRLIGAIPPVSIFFALGVVRISSRIAENASDRALKYQKMLFSLLMVGTTLWSVIDYFVGYANQPSLAEDFQQPDWELGQYAARFDSETQLYLSPPQEEMATIYFALGDPGRIASYNGEFDLIPAGVPGWPVAYLLRPNQDEGLTKLMAYFPDGRIKSRGNQWVSFSVPDMAERLPGLSEVDFSFADAINLRGWRVDPLNKTIVVTLAWQALTDIDLDYTAYVHLLDAGGHLVSQEDRQPEGYPTGDWKRGEIVVDRYTIPSPIELTPGSYRIQTGFYHLPKMVSLGQPATLTRDDASLTEIR